MMTAYGILFLSMGLAIVSIIVSILSLGLVAYLSFSKNLEEEGC